MQPSENSRIEKDLLGEKEVPASAYYGIQTARALENFYITGIPISQHKDLIKALAIVKLAAARANYDCGTLDEKILRGIEKACLDLMNGEFLSEFKIDVLQGGAGTSTNMNANEVIANRALEHMGFEKGDYDHCDPHDHVNCSQSTNDAYPTALHVGMILANVKLKAEMHALAASLHAKGEEFADVIKMGRTQLQDAVPMTLGQEFHAWASSLEGEIAALRTAERVLLESNMGGTAIGTGLNAPAGYAESCAKHLSKIMDLEFYTADDLVEATQDTQAFVIYSSIIKSLAIKLSKICNDLRLLSSGPRAGLNEINLPARQPGSSIMPGKVNPVIPEVMNQVCFRAIGNDLTVTLAAEAGQLQLNVMEPVIAHSILESQTMFMNASRTLRKNCIDGIEANRDTCRNFVEMSIGIVTALNPVLGYEKATELATEALRTGRGIIELVREQGLLDEETLIRVLDPASMLGTRD
ncbi:MAG: aspartate ammonia-lyase [Planctomycetota bacterium]|jgi:aspartate ammonia-lyase